MEKLTKEQIISQFPNKWVLVGDPELDSPNKLGSIMSKLLGGFVLLVSEDRREIGYKAKDVRKGFKSVTCVYTGIIPQNRKWLL